MSSDNEDSELTAKNDRAGQSIRAEDGQSVEDLFVSPRMETLKERLCDIGRRMWQREYVDGNGGNLTIRVGENLVLCTPTMISKGFMQPEDMCLIDLEGKQLAGRRPRTSEALTHIGIMKRQPKARACCHAHPPHATAYALAGKTPPRNLTPEAEIFLGEIGLSQYRTPGSPENAEEVGRVGKDHSAILMINHGVITWGKDMEDAYWKMENIEAYCKTVSVALQITPDLKTISGQHVEDLQRIRKQLVP